MPDREALRQLAERWKAKAIASIEESSRIRATIKGPTRAEDRCLVRADLWRACADELLALVDVEDAGSGAWQDRVPVLPASEGK